MSSTFSLPPPARQPTLHFIGVTTTKSSIMRVFPAWAKHLGLEGAAISGIDLPLRAPAADYRAVVRFLRDDPLTKGALVTTHKIDLYKACRDLFDDIDPHALAMGETSCLSKRGNRLVCHAKDPISSGLTVDGFLPANWFADGGGAVFAMGAGGSTIAITWHLMQASRGADRPSRIIVSDRDPERLAEIRHFHETLPARVPTDYVLVEDAATNDAVLAGLPPRSFVINATGLGKDRPGSPLSDAARFPEGAIAFDLNYRGDLVFLDQARAQAASRGLAVNDGWTYFIHGWTRVIAEVFDIEIATSGPAFEALSAIAAAEGGR